MAPAPHTAGVGTFQDPASDREWLRRSHVDTATDPYPPDARTEMVVVIAAAVVVGVLTR